MEGRYKKENHRRAFMTFCLLVFSDAAFTTQNFTFSPVVFVGSPYRSMNPPFALNRIAIAFLNSVKEVTLFR